ncbi:DUF2382 domain-containing protein [Enterococcus sp. AZ109]|uniref:DUF2382 domain-containing protein n=1 Tax=Enterococcus sp. AZ109 TaxID=2774634 RepID=UPI003F2189DF
MTKRITGSYATIDEVETAVQTLTAEGYPRESITLIVDKKNVPSLEYQDIHVETGWSEEEHDESLWDRIKGFFGGDDEEAMRRDYYETYRDDIARGNILVAIDTDRVPAEFEHGTETVGQPINDTIITDTTMDRAAVAPVDELAPEADVVGQPIDDSTNADEVLRMREERLDVEKENVQTGEAVVKKVVTEETQTVEVPVTKEELVIERKSVADQPSGDVNFQEGESEIRIPLSEEQVHVTKEPVVTEEVRISKREVQDTKSVSDTVHKEHLDVQSSDDSLVQEVDDPMDKR